MRTDLYDCCGTWIDLSKVVGMTIGSEKPLHDWKSILVYGQFMNGPIKIDTSSYVLSGSHKIQHDKFREEYRGTLNPSEEFQQLEFKKLFEAWQSFKDKHPNS